MNGMTAAVLGGIGVALGIVSLLRAMRPRVVSIEALIDTVTGQGNADAVPAGLRDRISYRCAGYLASSPVDTPALRADLSLTGTSLDMLAGEMAIAGLGAGVVLPAAWLLMTMAGMRVPFVVPAFVSLLAATAGAMIPLLSLRNKAAVMRRQFRRALGSFLELVSLAMAGAMGVEGALDGASAISDGWTFRRIRAALASARHRGEAPWEALGALGEEIRVPELAELASNLGLAGAEGARVRDTLASKAATLRGRELSDAEAEANATTEKMFVPGVLLLAGFMVFVGYPAVAHVFQTL